MAQKTQRDEDKVLLWMFENDKKNDKQPDLTGPGRINKSVLKGLVEAYKEFGDGESLKLRCAAWEREGKNGEYLFVTIEAEKPKPKGSDEPDDIPF